MSACTCLFYLLCTKQQDNWCLAGKLPYGLLLRLSGVLLDVVAHHLDSERVTTAALQNFSTLYHHGFLLTALRPEAVDCSLLVLMKHSENVQLVSAVLSMLNDYLIHLSSEQLLEIGRTGIVSVSLLMIQEKMHSSVLSPIEQLWYILWNLTDECPVNCRRFISSGGLRVFNNCYHHYEGYQTMVYMMLGVVWNIAEDHSLHRHLLKRPYITICLAIVKEFSRVNANFQSCFSSSAIIVHIMASLSEKPDCQRLWHKASPKISYNKASSMILDLMQKWDITVTKSESYRTLKSLVFLCQFNKCLLAQSFAVWSVANLSSCDFANKYCSMIVRDGAIDTISQLVQKYKGFYGGAYQRIVMWCKIVQQNVEAWKEGRLKSDADK